MDKKIPEKITNGVIDGFPAVLLGGEDGVFGIVGKGDLVILYSGDDGSWKQIGCYNRYWIDGIIACFRRYLHG